MLHLTNGDQAARRIRSIGVQGTVIAWRDVLHEGPVPANLSLEAMSDVRARFAVSCRWGTLPDISASLGTRDAALRSARRVILWFEHDLYDQLQLLQILDVLAAQPESSPELICLGAFPGVEPFLGLGQLSTAQIATLWPHRRPVTSAQLALGRRAWRAFCSRNTAAVPELLRGDLSCLPFLRPALDRLLEEYPAPPTGLSRTDRQILTAVAAGCQDFDSLFLACEQQESAPFMGDAVLELHLRSLGAARTPLLNPNPLTLTSAGQRVLAGELDAVQLNGIDRWIGGVHLVG